MTTSRLKALRRRSASGPGADLHIATRCHISKRNLYRLFPNKTEVVSAVIDDRRHSMLALPGDYDDLPLEEALGRISWIDIDEETHAKRLEVVRLVMAGARESPELAALIHERGGDKSRLMLAEWLEAQARRGRIEVDDAGVTAGILMDLIFGVIVLKQERGLPPCLGERDRSALLRRVIQFFVNGVRRR